MNDKPLSLGSDNYDRVYVVMAIMLRSFSFPPHTRRPKGDNALLRFAFAAEPAGSLDRITRGGKSANEADNMQMRSPGTICSSRATCSLSLPLFVISSCVRMIYCPLFYAFQEYPLAFYALRAHTAHLVISFVSFIFYRGWKSLDLEIFFPVFAFYRFSAKLRRARRFYS